MVQYNIGGINTDQNMHDSLCNWEKKKMGQKELKYELWPTKFVGPYLLLGFKGIVPREAYFLKS